MNPFKINDKLLTSDNTPLIFIKHPNKSHWYIRLIPFFLLSFFFPASMSSDNLIKKSNGKVFRHNRNKKDI